ncbi:hypothetical protein SCHPADRAFT_617529 [Schizopora paradoxa]|uniref:Uncharacterized protein n=1 Tax=Schizopora paradoxa TaxID=27342 RepID=A0A0H2R8K5_9AGAM|nr:hypothetical protein SCHPADRAFT_617529 [Schizopora paradoxa]
MTGLSILETELASSFTRAQRTTTTLTSHHHRHPLGRSLLIARSPARHLLAPSPRANSIFNSSLSSSSTQTSNPCTCMSPSPPFSQSRSRGPESLGSGVQTGPTLMSRPFGTSNRVVDVHDESFFFSLLHPPPSSLHARTRVHCSPSRQPNQQTVSRRLAREGEGKEGLLERDGRRIVKSELEVR